MRYKLLCKSGLRVSELCLGTMTFGEDWGWGASKEECRKIFDAYAAAGGNFIDTANNYTNGTAEKIVGELVDYKDGNAVLEGYLAYDDSIEGKAPAVLVFHEWKGLNAYAKRRANELADLGYVAFAADIYGKGVRPSSNEEAGAEAGKYKGDRQLLRRRANAALAVLREHPLVDPERLAAIGYCFGGMTALELARSGADMKGAVSFHGTLSTPVPADANVSLLVRNAAMNSGMVEYGALAGTTNASGTTASSATGCRSLSGS